MEMQSWLINVLNNDATSELTSDGEIPLTNRWLWARNSVTAELGSVRLQMASLAAISDPPRPPCRPFASVTPFWLAMTSPAPSLLEPETFLRSYSCTITWNWCRSFHSQLRHFTVD